MKRKVTMGVFAAIMAAFLMMGGVQVKAAGSNYSDVIEGTKTTTFDKYLVMDQDANVPNVTFTYGVTAGAAKTYDVTEKIQILEGVDADKVTMAGVGTTDAAANTIVYTPEDTKNTDIVKQDDNQLVKDYDKTTEKYAIKTATLDFSACGFTEPGIYRYILTENATTNTAITNDADATRVIDVYVYDASSEEGVKKLKIEDYVLHSNTDDAPAISMGDDNGSTGKYADTKSQGFTNTYDTSDLTFRKEVSGNQASRDKYFEFTVSITGATAGTVYDVDITGADTASGNNAATIDANKGKTNPEKLTADNDGKVTQKFYLQHGQEIKIEGIAKGTSYTVTENPEDYKSEAAVIEGYKDAATGVIASTNLKTSYLNTRDGVIPTGVAMTVAPFAGAVVLGGLGVVTFAGRKKREDEE